jgi:hypothetical protein
MKKRMLLTAIFSFVVIAELLSADAVSAADMAPTKSLSSRYYRIPAVTSVIANLAPSDPRLMPESQLVLATKDVMSLFDMPQTDERKFPSFDTLPGVPPYFVAHWSGSIIVPKDGDYRVMLSSHEASQLFINGVEIISVTPNDELGGKSLMVHLSRGASNVDVFFAKRSDFQSGLNFRIDDVAFTSSYQENMPTVGVVSPVTVTTNVVTSPVSTNSAPVVMYFNPPKTATPDVYFAYKLLAADAENASLAYTLVEAPQGMSIVPSSGLLLWKPSVGQLSQMPYPVVVQVSDGTRVATSRFEISVKFPVTNSALFPNTTNSQVSGSMTSEPARSAFAENISVSDVLKKETSAPAGSRLSASVLFTGVFTLGRWLAAHKMSIFYFLVSMMLTGLVVYVFLEIIDRNKRNKNFNRLVLKKDIASPNPMISQIENA